MWADSLEEHVRVNFVNTVHWVCVIYSVISVHIIYYFTDKTPRTLQKAHQNSLKNPENRHLSLSRFLSAMMRLSPHNTVTGGTTHGKCTIHWAAVPSNGVPGFHERDAWRVSAAGPTLRDRVRMPYGGVADGWETPDCSPVYRVQNLPAPNPRGSVIVYSAPFNRSSLPILEKGE